MIQALRTQQVTRPQVSSPSPSNGDGGQNIPAADSFLQSASGNGWAGDRSAYVTLSQQDNNAEANGSVGENSFSVRESGDGVHSHISGSLNGFPSAGSIDYDVTVRDNGDKVYSGWVGGESLNLTEQKTGEGQYQIFGYVGRHSVNLNETITGNRADFSGTSFRSREEGEAFLAGGGGMPHPPAPPPPSPHPPSPPPHPPSPPPAPPHPEPHPPAPPHPQPHPPHPPEPPHPDPHPPHPPEPHPPHPPQPHPPHPEPPHPEPHPPHPPQPWPPGPGPEPHPNNPSVNFTLAGDGDAGTLHSEAFIPMICLT